jgi:hypothetical protein
MSICFLIWLYSPLLGLGRLFSFFIFYTVGRTLGRVISLTQGRSLHTGQHIQTSIPQLGFEPTIPVFERAKTVHALDGAAIVIGLSNSDVPKMHINHIALYYNMSLNFIIP